MKKYLAALICLPAFLGFAHASTITVFDSLGGTGETSLAFVYQAVPGTDYYSSLYASFSTVNPSFMLGDVKVNLMLTAPAAAGAGLDISLYRNSGTATPGSWMSLLGTISDSSLTTTPANYDFPVSPLALSPGRYWIGISSFDNSTAAWGVTYDTSGAGVMNEYFGDPNPNDKYFPNVGSNYSVALKMDVNGADVPEPSTILLGAIGLAMLAAYRRRVVS